MARNSQNHEITFGFPALKRMLDLAGAVPGLLLLFPILAGVALLIKVTSRGPVFFRQKRPGLGGKTFQMIKFRTMREGPGEDAARITGLGHLLRRWSLDELPELFNVIKGEMSLVGPRPLLVRYLERYSPEQARRHEVLPGITGWAQVNGRNAQSWAQRFKLDVWYVDNRSLWLDIKILLLTVAKVISGSGISAPGHATKTEFTGDPSQHEFASNDEADAEQSGR
jgi:sugar transferase EpsL